MDGGRKQSSAIIKKLYNTNLKFTLKVRKALPSGRAFYG